MCHGSDSCARRVHTHPLPRRFFTLLISPLDLSPIKSHKEVKSHNTMSDISESTTHRQQKYLTFPSILRKVLPWIKLDEVRRHKEHSDVLRWADPGDISNLEGTVRKIIKTPDGPYLTPIEREYILSPPFAAIMGLGKAYGPTSDKSLQIPRVSAMLHIVPASQRSAPTSKIDPAFPPYLRM